MAADKLGTNAGGRFYDFFGNSVAQNIYKDSVAYQRESLYIAVPCRIENVDSYEEKQVVDARILINDVYNVTQGKVLEQTVMKDIFVRLKGAGGFEEKHPVEVDDIAAMYFSHKDLTKFLAGNGSDVDVSIADRGKMNDCWIELGFGTKSNNYKPSLTDLIVKGPKSTSTTKPDGTHIYENENCTTTHAADGTVSMTNSAGAVLSLNTDGTVTINGATILPDGNIITAAGTEIDNHKHGGVVPGRATTSKPV